MSPARLEAWLASSIAGFRRPLGVRRFGDGQSNPTFLLTTPESKYVLRKKPHGAAAASNGSSSLTAVLSEVIESEGFLRKVGV